MDMATKVAITSLIVFIIGIGIFQLEEGRPIGKLTFVGAISVLIGGVGLLISVLYKIWF